VFLNIVLGKYVLISNSWVIYPYFVLDFALSDHPASSRWTFVAANTSQEQKASLDVINTFFTHGIKGDLSLILLLMESLVIFSVESAFFLSF
jgi:hypothetical protein